MNVGDDAKIEYLENRTLRLSRILIEIREILVEIPHPILKGLVKSIDKALDDE